MKTFLAKKAGNVFCNKKAEHKRAPLLRETNYVLHVFIKTVRLNRNIIIQRFLRLLLLRVQQFLQPCLRLPRERG